MIFDIGVNKGEDSRFYLDKGFKVVGVEASPIIAAELKKTFKSEIESGSFILLECGVWHESSVLTFYRNLDNDHWSSFDPVYGCRNDTSFETIDVPCITVDKIFSEFGIPRYLKIDVEGADKYIVDAIAKSQPIPTFISVEEYGVDALNSLYKAGYKHFKFPPQRDKSLAIPPNPAAEGEYVEKQFSGYDSGLFGLELPGEWLDFEQAREKFLESIRDENHVYVGPENEWYDIHAMAGE